MKGIISPLLVTRADPPRAVEIEPILETARQVFDVSVQTNVPVAREAAAPVEMALARALELAAETDQVIVSAGIMFVTVEVVNADKRI